MNIQAEKIELIRLIADIDSEKVLKKIRAILSAQKKEESNVLSPAMVKHLEESRQQVKEGKVTKIDLDDLWK